MYTEINKNYIREHRGEGWGPVSHVGRSSAEFYKESDKQANINRSSMKKEHRTVGYREKYIYSVIREGEPDFLRASRRRRPANSPWIMRSRDLNLPLTDPGD